MGEILKPLILADKILTTEEQVTVKTALLSSNAAIFKSITPIKNDYLDKYSRGTVKFDEKHRNYSFSKVVVPDGTIIKECNFTQRTPNTLAITGKNLVFIGCNLTNNVIDKSWDVTTSAYGEIDFAKQEAVEAMAKGVVQEDVSVVEEREVL
jgi:hypothetical protein